MTNDYYVNLADYYTNQLSIGTPAETVNLKASFLTIGFDTYFTSTLGASNYTIEKWLTWNGSNNIIAYGTIEISGVNKNYILRVPYSNGTYDVSNAECFTTYVGGTSLPYFWDLKVDTDGTLYGIVSSDSYFALIMLANPFTTGGIKFRQSYALPTSYSSYTNYQELIKKENTGEYLIILNDGGANTLIYHLTIFVGGTNDWVATTINSYIDIYDYYIAWGENISLSLLAYDNSGEGSGNVLFDVYSYNGTSIAKTNSYSLSIGTTFRSVSAKYFNETTFYYLVTYLDNYGGGNGTIYNILYKANLLDNSSTALVTETSPYTTSTPYVLLSDIKDGQQIEVINGIVYFKYLKTDNPNLDNRNVYGIIIGDKIYKKDSVVFYGFFNQTNYKYFFVSNIFNKYKIVKPSFLYTDVIEFQYNPNGYNGTKYIDTNMFVPEEIELYDNSSPAQLLFDRGLYNLKVYNNVTESTFNVPYTMLNSEIIQQAKLYGETNYNLVDSYINVNKNVYENLMINFFNSIVVKDYTGRIYNSGGARVNDSISKTNDMASASAGKIKVFYNDGTDYTYGLPAPTITGVGNPMTITYEIPLVVDSDGYALKYQILSNDENTLYFEYDTSSLNAGTYKITQECKIK